VTFWQDKLAEVEVRLPYALRGFLQQPEDWRSLLIDYEPPKVERLWIDWDEECRVSLHRIHPCETSLFHPHPSPSIIRVIDDGGGYLMDVGHGPGDTPPPIAIRLRLSSGSVYEMSDIDGWHSVQPLVGPSYSLMVTGKPWKRSSPGKGIPHPPLPLDLGTDLLNAFRGFYPVRRVTLTP